MEKVYIISHTDLDGYFSGGLVQYYCQKFINKDAEFVHKSWTYGRNLPVLYTIKNMFDTVFVVDLTLPEDFMLSLYEAFGDNFIWIDHHIKPNTEFYSKFKEKYPDKEINGLHAKEEHSESAALLTYLYFQKKYDPKSTNRIQNPPEWIQLISEFDCWNRTDEDRWQNKIMPFLSFLKGEITNPREAYNYCISRDNENKFYDPFQERTNKEITEGKLLYKAIKSMYNADAKHGFRRTLYVLQNNEQKILNAWVCNTQSRSSVIFEDMPDVDTFDVFIPYHFNGERYLYSMYTFKSDISCNEITIVDSNFTNPCLSFQGHKDAAGANSENFVFA